MNSGVTDGAVFRPTLVRVLAVLLTVGAVAAFVGNPSWVVAAFGALVVYLAVVTLWSPALHATGGAVVLSNPFREITIPWGAIDNVDTRYALTISANGRKYACWVAPSPGRGAARRLAKSEHDAVPRSAFADDGTLRPGDLPDSDSGRALRLIYDNWGTTADRGPVQVHWRLRTIAVGVILLAAAVLSWWQLA